MEPAAAIDAATDTQQREGSHSFRPRPRPRPNRLRGRSGSITSLGSIGDTFYDRASTMSPVNEDDEELAPQGAPSERRPRLRMCDFVKDIPGQASQAMIEAEQRAQARRSRKRKRPGPGEEPSAPPPPQLSRPLPAAAGGVRLRLVDGRITVDEEDLEVHVGPEERSSAATVTQHDIPEFNVYQRRTRGGQWSVEDTRRFYDALRHCGTDFSMIAELFPDRSRRDIRNKFKREERLHPALVDQAVGGFLKADFTKFESILAQRQQESLAAQEECGDAAAGGAASATGTTPAVGASPPGGAAARKRRRGKAGGSAAASAGANTEDYGAEGNGVEDENGGKQGEGDEGKGKEEEEDDDDDEGESGVGEDFVDSDFEDDEDDPVATTLARARRVRGSS